MSSLMPDTAGTPALARPAWRKRLSAVWGSPMVERRQAGGLGVLWALVLLVLVLGPLALGVWIDALAAGIGLAGGLCTLTLAGWMALVTNVLRQNQPGLAQLVPGHVRALRQSLWLFVAASSALLGLDALMVCWLFEADAGAHTRLAALVIPGFPLFMGVLALSMRWPVLNLLWLALPLLPLVLSQGDGAAQWQTWVQRYLDAGPQLWTLALAASLLWCAAVAWGLVLSGGPGHQRAHRRVALLAMAQPQGVSADAAWRAWGLGNERWLAWLSGAALRRRRLQHALNDRPHPRWQPRTLWDLGLPAELQPLDLLAQRLPGAVLLLAATVLVATLPHGSPLQSGLQSIVYGLLLGGSAVALNFERSSHALCRTQKEQALLRLLPGAPTPARLNRWLALRLAACALLQLGLSATVLLLGLQMIHGQDSGWARMIEAGLVLSLACVPLQWRDWSRQAPHLDTARMLPILLGFGLGMGLNGLVWLARPQALGILWALELTLAVAWGLWRWQRLAHEPCAWPVGQAISRRRGAVT